MSKRRDLSDWFAELFHLKDVPFMGVPDYMFSIEYWLGGIAASALAWQVLTGLLLLFYYEPSNAYSSTMFVIHNVPFGSILLSSHLYGAYIMIFAVYLHGLYMMVKGGYKKPRGFQWVLGVLMFILTLGVAFIGYSLTGDVLATDAVDVGKGILSEIGLQSLAPILFGNGTQLDLFTRLIAWHITIAAAVILLFLLHFYLAEENGLMPRLRDVGYKAPAVIDKRGLPPWWPRNFVYMVAIALMTWGIIILIPSILALPNVYPNVLILFSPYPGPSPTSPQAAAVPAYPPWFFLVIYKMADMPFGLAVDEILSIAVPAVILLLVPVLDRSDRLHPLDRPGLLALMLVGLTWLIELSVWSAIQPGIPVEPAWAAIVMLPPLAIIIAGVYALHRLWLRVRSDVLARSPASGKSSSWALGKSAAVAIGYVTAVLAIINIALSVVLDPISEGPYIGVLWGAALLSLSATVFSYFYSRYILEQ